MIVSFFIYSAATGALLPGVVATFAYYRRRNSDGSITDLIGSAPAIADSGGGRYEFTVPDGQLTVGSVVDYVIDLTIASASRYEEGSVDSDAVAAEADDVSSTVPNYGVTASSVRKHHFPNGADFSDTSNPTVTTVTEKIEDAAGELTGRLLKEDISAATIDAGGATYAPYLILRKTLRKMVAVEVGPAMNEDSKRIDRWARELKVFFDQLEEDAATALGDDTLTSGSSEASGPTTHIDQYNLDVGDPTTDASDAIPPFRKSDEL
jgi:hypothetical protein